MAQPAVADVRVSCPACGGPVHPIAGRCKHCRTDLVAARGGATGAQGTMIQIGQLGRAAVPAPAAPAAAAPPLVTPRPTGLPVAAPAVPPPVGFAPAVAARPRGGWGKRWPLLVAAVAALAIIASVVVLVLGSGSKSPKKRRTLGPAPDRMSTDQLPTDPWARGSGSANPDGELLPPTQVPDINPSNDDPPPPEPEEDDEPGGVPGGVQGGIDPNGRTLPMTARPDQFFDQAIEVTCKRLAACWGDTNADSMCEQGRAMLRAQGASVVGTLCPTIDRDAANQCLSQLASLPCPDQSVTMNDLATMAYGIDPCMRACER